MSNPIVDELTKQKLLDLLKDDKITRQDIAERLHCSVTTVGQWALKAGIRAREPKHEL